MHGWNFNGHYNILTTPRGVTIKTPSLVMEHIVTHGLYIAILASDANKVINENVVAFGATGEMAWQIEQRQEMSGNMRYCYETIDADFRNEQLIKVWNWNHYVAFVDIATGKIKELIDTLPNWKVSGDVVLCPNKIQVKIICDIKKYDQMIDDLLVLADPFLGAGAENIFLISRTGQIKWRVESISETANDPSDSYIGYSGLSEDKKTIRLYSFKGTINTIDINTGKSIKTQWTK